MPTREEMIKELRRRDIIDQLKTMDQQKSTEDEIPGYDVVNSLARGTTIAENMPGGKTAADIGGAIGSGIVAATTTAPGEDYFSRLGQSYDQVQGAMAKADAERTAIDAKAPITQGVKEILGAIPMMAQRQATPSANEMTPGQFQYPGGSGQASLDKLGPQITGTLQSYADPAKQFLLNYLKRKFGP